MPRPSGGSTVIPCRSAEVQIPAGLAAGEAVPYQTSVVIPSTPVPDVSSSGGTLYITAVVNPATHGRRKQLP